MLLGHYPSRIYSGQICPAPPLPLPSLPSLALPLTLIHSLTHSQTLICSLSLSLPPLSLSPFLGKNARGLLLVGCLTSQQQASVSQGRICSDSCTCCHTEIEVADQTFYLTQSQYTDTGPTSPSADPRTPGAWQGSHWSTMTIFESLV